MEEDINHCHQCGAGTALTKDGMFAVCFVSSCPSFALAQISEDQMFTFVAEIALDDKDHCKDCGGKLKKGICKDCAF